LLSAWGLKQSRYNPCAQLQEYAENDSRIKYYRNKVNVGAARNHNLVFELSRGKYFKWAAYDDILAPQYLEKCLKVLNQDSNVVLCHSKTVRIDENNNLLDHYNFGVRLLSTNKLDCFADTISTRNFAWILILGVIRSSALKQTQLLGSYISADRTLLAEISLLGKYYVVPEDLFFRREHSSSYTDKQHVNYQAKMMWWSNYKQPKLILPYTILYREYLKAVKHSKLNWTTRQLCNIHVLRWFFREGWLLIIYDVGINIVSNPTIRKIINPLQKRLFQKIGIK